jgi:catechol 2,3-dioxygenase-like lactoylglutathione lyase family enzyme
MTMTTRVQSVSIPVADQDRALAFYTEVLGCELRTDIEVWPGARLVEVVPPGSSVGLVLLPPDSEIPMAVRLGTTSAETAYARLRQACTSTATRRCSFSPTRTATGSYI